MQSFSPIKPEAAVNWSLQLPEAIPSASRANVLISSFMTLNAANPALARQKLSQIRDAGLRQSVGNYLQQTAPR